jgi:hypothetical protein
LNHLTALSRFNRLTACLGTTGLLLLLAAAGCGRPRPAVSVASEAAVLTNLMSLCMPPAGESGMISTYDRRGGNADWWDVPRPVPGSTNLYEMFRMDGPGCIKRIWETNVPVSEWLFFFDGESEPRYRTENFFAADAEGVEVRGGASGGVYSYLPIPFAKSVRILLRMPEVAANARPYFHLNYECYPAGTPVVSWPAVLGADTSNTLTAVRDSWRLAADENRATIRRLGWRKIVVPPRQQVELFSENRGGTLVALGVRPQFGRQNAVMRSLLLRTLVLEGRWDESAQPSIQAPLGDFFCNGLHPREFSSLPMAYLEGAYLCRLPMPFRHKGRLVVRNDGPVEATLEVATEFVPGRMEERLYLHAGFQSALSPGVPLRILQTTGAGKYVGVYLVALGMDGSWNILEGDERFYRDGGREAVHHGTGLEDYFNAGWYYFGLFELPLHGLLEKAAMRTAQYRFHLTDPVTFRKDLRMEIEFGDANRAGGYLSSCAFWYQDRPAGAGSALPPAGERFPPLEQVGLLAIMDELFELERMGLVADLEERCAFYAWAHPQPSERALFQLRMLAYREMRQGFAAVRDGYAAVAAATNLPPEVIRQARMLQWRGEGPGRAIFGAHAYAAFRLLVDGKPLGGGNNPFVWEGWPVELAPGEHVLQAEVTPAANGAFFSAGFSGFFTNVVSDTGWDSCLVKPQDWPAGGGTRDPWHPYDPAPGMFPNMAWWRFAPNAFPFVQSGHQTGMPGGAIPGQTVYLRRRIVVPSITGDRPVLPPRRTRDEALPVRPKDDTSNANLDTKAM